MNRRLVWIPVEGDEPIPVAEVLSWKPRSGRRQEAMVRLVYPGSDQPSYPTRIAVAHLQSLVTVDPTSKEN